MCERDYPVIVEVARSRRTVYLVAPRHARIRVVPIADDGTVAEDHGVYLVEPGTRNLVISHARRRGEQPSVLLPRAPATVRPVWSDERDGCIGRYVAGLG